MSAGKTKKKGQWPRITITGGGLVGSLLAVFLSPRASRVDVYERRPDMRKEKMSAGRSINLALSDRGWRAIEKAGVAPDIHRIAIPMYGRMIHHPGGSLSYQPYGKKGQAIYSVSRAALNQALLSCAERMPNVRLHFNLRCADVDLLSRKLYLEDASTGRVVQTNYDLLFGADGAFSAARAALQKSDRFDYSQAYLEHSYKELSIPPAPGGGWRMEKNALHIWPRRNYMLIALPNLDGSFTCTLFYPFEGQHSFLSLDTPRKVTAFFKKELPDALKLMPSLEHDFFVNPTSSLVTVRCSPWNFGGRVLLVGDAAHAIVPFFGQGMNAGFEDCTVLDKLLGRHQGDWEKVIPLFASARKPDADAVADLALGNFLEMRDKVADPAFLLRKKIEGKLYDWFPDRFVPLYTLVTFSDKPYSYALRCSRLQDRLFEEMMADKQLMSSWEEPSAKTKLEALVNAYAGNIKK